MRAAMRTVAAVMLEARFFSNMGCRLCFFDPDYSPAVVFRLAGVG
jgi:hypothetical protein